MQISLIDGNLAQRSALPLPSAALVIDMRSNSQDNVIERLRIEITDLAGEMKFHNMNHWRFLTDFLAFRVIMPLRAEEVEVIRSQMQPRNGGQPVVLVPKDALKPEKTPLMGPTGPSHHAPQGSRFPDDPGRLISEGKPFDVFQQRIGEIVQEIDRLRNNRIKAINDLSKDGIPGHSIRDATVRVIFLTNSEDHESLLSASTYAAHLKESVGKLERKSYQSLVSTTVVCLDNRGEAGPPADIIQGLRWNGKWDHLDSLIVSEKYADNAALMAGAMQAYLAELLLYVLLIVPPIKLKQSITDLAPNRQIEAQVGGNQPKGEWVTLPYHSYLVGLGSMEHSARWGRRWLNYGLVAHAAEMLQNRILDDKEEARSKNIALAWLDSWRGHVEEAIPDRIPGNIPMLQAIPNASNVAKPAQEAFTSDRFTYSIGAITISDLERYLGDLEETYTASSKERMRRFNKIQEPGPSQHASPTLQDAIDSIPLIQQHLRDWEDKDPTLKKGMPLVNAQLEAQRVLTNPSFFTSVTGAVLRARIQLRELGNVIADFQSTYQQTFPDLLAGRTNLNRRGRALIDDLKKHIERIPFLGKVLYLVPVMAVLTFVLTFSLIFLAVLLGLTWLGHLVFEKDPQSSFLSTFNIAFNPGESLIAYIVWGAIIVIILAILLIFRRSVMGDGQSVWRKEITCWLMLIVFALAGSLFSFSLGQFVNDPGSLALLGWLGALPYFSGITAILALVMLIIEVFWFWRWYDYLMVQRVQVINSLQTQHMKNVNEVSQYISDTVALQLLQRTGLTDGNGGPGSYYTHVDQLYKQLVEIASQAKIQTDLAAKRLVLSLSDTQPGSPRTGGPWLNLDIREEWLDVETLTAGFQRLSNRLTNEVEEFKEFAQMLLRIMGEETPIQIEQHFREKPFTGKREQRHVEVLMITLAALVLRFSVGVPTVDSISPIIERYDMIADQYNHQLISLGILIDTLRKRVRDIHLQPLLISSSATASSQSLSQELIRENTKMATGAFAAWTQMLWEGEEKDDKLNQTLAEKGVLAQLIEHNQDPKAVMRRLYTHTMLFGRSDSAGDEGEGFLLLSPSAESSDFRQSLNIPGRLIVDFPDPERLLLFYIQRYTREALFIAEPDASPSRLTVEPGALTFSATGGIVSQNITIGNPGNDVLAWTAELDAGAPAFLTLATPSTMSLIGKSETILNVHVNTAGLTSASTFTTGITLNAFDPQTGKAVMGSPITIPVSIDIIPATLQLSETALTFAVTSGSHSLMQAIQVTNTSQSPLTWTIEQPPQAWLTVNPLTGSYAPGETAAVTFAVDATNLLASTYYATIAIKPSQGTNLALPIKLIVA